jgi:hypothetical protein
MDAHRQHFTVAILPVVTEYARVAFAEHDPDEKEERIAEAVAAAFVSFLSLVERGRDTHVTAGNLAFYAVKHVRGGRHVGGCQERAKDALTKRDGMVVVRFGSIADLPTWMHDALADNRYSPVPEQAAFRIDFPQFLAEQGELNRYIAARLAIGVRANEVVDEVGLSCGRITQIRQQMRTEWELATM